MIALKLKKILSGHSIEDRWIVFNIGYYPVQPNAINNGDRRIAILITSSHFELIQVVWTIIMYWFIRKYYKFCDISKDILLWIFDYMFPIDSLHFHLLNLLFHFFESFHFSSASKKLMTILTFYSLFFYIISTKWTFYRSFFHIVYNIL